MSDLKEETSVDKNESEQAAEETSQVVRRKPVDPGLEGIQLFYEKNKKMVNYLGGGLLAVVAILSFYKFFYLPDKENEASNEIFWAQSYFEIDSFKVALNGGVTVFAPEGQKQMMGFAQIAEDYSMTKTGSLANYCAGICCLRTGQYDQAIEYLQKYDGNDAVIAPIAMGATGDSYMELNKTEEAIKFYLKAAEKSNNSFTTPLYLKKAGFAYELKANYTEALNVYERIQKEYTKSAEGKEIERDIARVKAVGNL